MRDILILFVHVIVNIHGGFSTAYRAPAYNRESAIRTNRLRIRHGFKRQNAVRPHAVRTGDAGHRLRESQQFCQRTVRIVDPVNPFPNYIQAELEKHPKRVVIEYDLDDGHPTRVYFGDRWGLWVYDHQLYAAPTQRLSGDPRWP